MDYLNKIIQGDALEVLRKMPDNLVDCCVTSPPYWGLRSYSTNPEIWDAVDGCSHDWSEKPMTLIHDNRNFQRGSQEDVFKNPTGTTHIKSKSVDKMGFCIHCNAWRGELGLEPTPELYVKHLVDIFREVGRVLKPAGTLWLNLGDSYYGSGGVDGMPEDHVSISGANRQKYAKNNPNKRGVPGLKPKDLVGIPWMAAFALRADGWWLRSDIIWAKKNSMPESVNDRPTKSHEYIFLMTKSKKYFYDSVAIAEPIVAYSRAFSYNNPDNRKNTGTPDEKVHKGLTPETQNKYYEKMRRGEITTKNKRSVWFISTKSFPGAHFATFNDDLIRPCILAGSSEKGCCPECGAPWERIVEKEAFPIHGGGGERHEKYCDDMKISSTSSLRTGIVNKPRSFSWQPTCKHKNKKPVPSVVLDPFMGSGTTAAVSLEHGRNFIGVELNPEYIKMAEARLSPHLHAKKTLDEFFI